MPGDESGFDRLLKPKRSHLIIAEFLSSSAHVPIAIALATVLSRPLATWPLIVPLLAGAFIQAWVIAVRVERTQPPSFILNQVGPSLLTIGMAVSDWQSLLREPYLPVYWITSILVGACQGIGPRLPKAWSEATVVTEHVVRSLSMVAIYAAVYDGIDGFLIEPGHRFLVVATGLIGCALGVAAVMHRRDRARLDEVAARLRGYSEMLLGKSMLNRAMGRDDDLRPRRTRRSVLFADIRGFTKWSESHAPEEVLLMLDGVYGAAEQACAQFKPARTKHTGDEVMMFFSEPLAAARAAMALRDEVGAFLSFYGLHVGIGLHHGDVIEGLVGAVRTKAYDILGDTVNTAKRVSDHAKAGRIVVTFTFYEACRGRAVIAADERIHAKGKTSAVLVAELLGVQSDPAGDEAHKVEPQRA
jgi:adenylate cyclase